MELNTVVKVALALLPRAVIAIKQNDDEERSLTAYSTAVGPSSRFRRLIADAVTCDHMAIGKLNRREPNVRDVFLSSGAQLGSQVCQVYHSDQ